MKTGSGSPQWLVTALDDSLVALGANADESTRKKEIGRVLDSWNMRGRTYHNARYLGRVLENLGTLEDAAVDPDALRVAFAYRGALEEVGWEDSGLEPVPASVPATGSLKGLLDLGVPQERTDRVADLVRQLSTHIPDDDDLDARLIIDADMAVLAAPPQHYRAFVDGLRRESPHMDSVFFLHHRRKAIQRVLARRHIFFSPLGRKWDESARENLEAELESIEEQLLGAGESLEDHTKEADVKEQRVIRRSIRVPSVATKLDAPAAPKNTESVENADEDPHASALVPASQSATTSTLEAIPDFWARPPRHRDH